MAIIFELFTLKQLYFHLAFLTIYSEAGSVISYNNTEDFYDNITRRDHFVLFYTSWCGHCLRVKPIFEKLAERYNHDKDKVILAKVDCDNLLPLCTNLDIIRYPTLQFYWAGHERSFIFKGKKTFVNFYLFLERMTRVDQPPAQRPSSTVPPLPSQQSGPFELTSNDFHDVISSPHYNFIKFFVPWCSHCQAMSAVWKHLRDDYLNTKKINIAKVDCTKHGGICEAQGIKGYPSLVVFKNGEIISQYYGERDYDMLKGYIQSLISAGVEDASTNDDINLKTSQSEISQFDIFEDLSMMVTQQDENIEKPLDDSKEIPFEDEFELTANNFRSEIMHKVHFILFFTTSCNFCKSIKEDWIELRKSYVHSEIITISQVNCISQKDLCKEENVTSFPSIFVYYKGKKALEYQSERNFLKLKEFIQSFHEDQPFQENMHNDAGDVIQEGEPSSKEEL